MRKSWADEVAISDHRLLIGTPAYMAPEQFLGDAVDPRADLFSLGCVLYRMAAGKRPFGGDNVFSVVRALALDNPIPLASVNPQVPPSLSDLVCRLLSKSPHDRPATSLAIVEELRTIERDLALQHVTEAAAQRNSSGSGQPRRRRANWAVGASLSLAVLLVLGYLAFGTN